MAGLAIVEADGLAGATVDALTARMGDGLSSYHDGVISAANATARASRGGGGHARARRPPTSSSCRPQLIVRSRVSGIVA